MKRFTMLALVLALVVAWAASASAAEVKVRGDVRVDAMWGDGGYQNFWAAKDGNNAYVDKNQIEERARIMWDFVANENLKFTMQTQIGGGRWGQNGFGLGQGDARTNTSTSLRVREAYLDFNVPQTDVNVKAGYMLMYLPAANAGGSPILNDNSAGALLVSTPIIKDTVSVLVGYTRLFDSTNANNTANAASTALNGYGMKDELDAAILAVPLSYNKIDVTPWMVYGWGGRNSLADASSLSSAGYGADLNGLLAPRVDQALTSATPQSFQKGFNVWWAGLATTVKMFDPIVFGLDYNYGSLSGMKAVDGALAPWDDNKLAERRGWYIDTFIRYTGLDMVKPELFFAYSSGEDSDPTNGSERMPTLAGSGYALNISWYTGGSNFGQTDPGDQRHNVGFWALGLGLNQITFMEKLSHDFLFMYAQGTNSADLLRDPNMRATAYAWGGNAQGMGGIAPGHFLTTKDHFFEIDLNTKYKIYDELTAILELGYINMNCNKDLWNDYIYGVGSTNDQRTFKASDAYKVAMGVRYDF